MIFTFFFSVVWMVLVAGFSGVLFYHIQAKIVCDEFEDNTGVDDPNNCFHYVDTGKVFWGGGGGGGGPPHAGGSLGVHCMIRGSQIYSPGFLDQGAVDKGVCILASVLKVRGVTGT